MMGGAMMTTHSDDSDEEDDKILVTAHFASSLWKTERIGQVMWEQCGTLMDDSG